MTALITLLWDICRLRKGPEDMPYSPMLLGWLVGISVLLGWYQFSYRAEFAVALWHAILMLSASMMFTALILYVKGHLSRLVQTLTAIIGVNVLMNIIVMPLVLLQPFLVVTEPVKTFNFTLFLILVVVMIQLFLNVWLIIITAHIFRRALDTNFATGALVAIAMLGLDIILITRFIA